MSTNTSIETAIYRGEGDTETEIEVTVEGTVIPYWPGNYDNPPEGGYVEDLMAWFRDPKTKKKHEVELTKDEVETFSEQLTEEADSDEPDYEED